MILANAYRSHACDALTLKDVDQTVRLAGWVHRKRDHGNLLFVDVRDHYGITQIVVRSDHAAFAVADAVRPESVIQVVGTVVARTPETVNPKIPTGDIEVVLDQITVLAEADTLPFPVNSDVDTSEELRLRHRYLDLRREGVHNNIVLRSNIIQTLRQSMLARGFLELQTPILTASSPEGARDYVVPSRQHPGKFYALPQAPQMFKQLFMVAGFDKYFQIAPCFRDEDSRADRSPGEFYQLDLEMSFVTQEEVFATLEPVLHNLFTTFAGEKTVSPLPFPRITYDQALLQYGCDKPDLRSPILCCDATGVFAGSGFQLFANRIAAGDVVRAIPAPGAASQSRKFYDDLNAWARAEGAGGLGYVIFEGGEAKGPIAKNLDAARLESLKTIAGLKDGDAVFFACGRAEDIPPFVARARMKISHDLNLVQDNHFAFCWVVDYPMFEYDPKAGGIAFSHNPFSMPQGGLEALNTQDPLTIKAYQYDIVCNGIELCSGAIRNHRRDIMMRAFEIAGYTAQHVESHFPALMEAFRYGAPPHGGAAPGIDRMVMLLAGSENIREVIAFPMTQRAEDLMMSAPAEISDHHKRELFIQSVLPVKPVTGHG